MVDLIGIEHVGISSDFDGGGGVMGWKDASETFNVTLELVRRGYNEEEIAKLWDSLFEDLQQPPEQTQVARRLLFSTLRGLADELIPGSSESPASLEAELDALATAIEYLLTRSE